LTDTRPVPKVRDDSNIPLYFRTQDNINWALPDPLTHANQIGAEISGVLADERQAWDEMWKEHGVEPDRST
jgi:hypothetical protein